MAEKNSQAVTMRTKRQPTIKTWLLVMAIVAVTCTCCRMYYNRMARYDEFKPLLLSYWCPLLASAVVFSTVPPFIFTLCFRSVTLVAASCIGFGTIWIALSWLSSPHLLTLWFRSTNSQMSLTVIATLYGICDGPFLALWYRNGPLFSFDSMVNAGWLVGYALIGMLFAGSCRLREQPGQAE